MTLGERIRKLRLARHWTQKQLVAEVQKAGGELSQPQLSAIETQDVISPGSLPYLAHVFGVAPMALLADDKVIELQPISREIVPLDVQPPPKSDDDENPDMLILYKTALRERGRQDGFMLIREKRGEVERPEFLRFSKNAFSFRVLDARNHPTYRIRDVLLIDPDSERVVGEDCIFTGELSPAPGKETVIGCLVRETAALWIVSEYNVRGERELSRETFPHAWPIVGRYHRR